MSSSSALAFATTEILPGDIGVSQDRSGGGRPSISALACSRQLTPRFVGRGPDPLKIVPKDQLVGSPQSAETR